MKSQANQLIRVLRKAPRRSLQHALSKWRSFVKMANVDDMKAKERELTVQLMSLRGRFSKLEEKHSTDKARRLRAQAKLTQHAPADGEYNDDEIQLIVNAYLRARNEGLSQASWQRSWIASKRVLWETGGWLRH